MKTCRYFFAIVLFLPMLARAGTLEFVKRSLDFDISQSAFGTALTNFPNPVRLKEVGRAGTNEWYRTSLSEAYEARHPGRTLMFGFVDGRLASLQFDISGIDSDKEKAKPLKASLDKILADFQKLDRKSFDGAPVRRDHDLQIRYEAFCSPMENFFAMISVTPPK